MKEIRSYIKDKGVLLFDGGMGTFYAARNRTSHRDCEWANLSAPGEIEAIHRAYLEVGCRAIKTNTYGANRQNFPASDCAAIIREGWLIARRAAAGEAYVFADIGPIDARDDTDLLEEYHAIVDQFLSLGARHFLFETIATDLYLHEIAKHIKDADPDAFVLVSFAAQPDGFTRDGRLIGELCRGAAADAYIDAVGLNCVSGGRQMVELLRKLGFIHARVNLLFELSSHALLHRPGEELHQAAVIGGQAVIPVQVGLFDIGQVQRPRIRTHACPGQGPQEAVCREERHLRVVADEGLATRTQDEALDSIPAVFGTNRLTRQEFHRIAEGIARSAAHQRTANAVPENRPKELRPYVVGKKDKRWHRIGIVVVQR